MKSLNKVGRRLNPETCLRLQIRLTVCLENLGIIRSGSAAPTTKNQQLRLLSHCELIMIVACCFHFTPCNYCAVRMLQFTILGDGRVTNCMVWSSELDAGDIIPDSPRPAPRATQLLVKCVPGNLPGVTAAWA